MLLLREAEYQTGSFKNAGRNTKAPGNKNLTPRSPSQTASKYQQPANMKWAKTIQELSLDDLHKLTHLLSLRPSTSPSPHETWLQDQAQRILNLPPALQKSPSLLSRLATSLPLSPSKAYLCAAHRALNPYVIHHAFLLICAECTTRLARLVERSVFLPARISEFVDRLHGVNALWMVPGVYYLAFGEVSIGRERMASGCEACVLAAVGGDDAALSDLRAALVGRRKRNRPVAELLPLVEAWIGCSHRSEEIYAESNVLGAEILRCRREMQKARRWEKRSVAGWVMDKEALSESMTLVCGGSGGGERDDHDFEESIINFYANRLSITSLISGPLRANDIDPALRNLRPFPPIIRAIRRAWIELRRPSWHTAYSESIYSNPSGTMNPSLYRDSRLIPERERVERYVEEYRELVVVAEQDE